MVMVIRGNAFIVVFDFLGKDRSFYIVFKTVVIFDILLGSLIMRQAPNILRQTVNLNCKNAILYGVQEQKREKSRYEKRMEE